MTVESTDAVTSTDTEIINDHLLGEFAEMLRQVSGESGEWVSGITPNARLEGDLGLESIEVAALGGLLRERYGAAADLPGLLAGLGGGQLLELAGRDPGGRPRRSGGDPSRRPAARKERGPPGARARRQPRGRRAAPPAPS